MSVTTRIRSIDPDEPDHAALNEAAAILRAGGLVAFATETVYGLGADATNPDAVARIFEAKGRPAFNPLIVHADEITLARRCVADWPDVAQMLAERFWPGPLTLVLPRAGIIPDIVTAGRDTVGVRVPLPNVARALIGVLDRPLAAPSANRSTGISPTRAEHVREDLEGKVEMILDSGPTTIGLESTVLDLTASEPRILRPGPISAEDLERALGGRFVREPSREPVAPDRPASPGQMRIHYAPHTPAVRVAAEDVGRITWPQPSALLVFGRHDLGPLEGFAHRFDLETPTEAGKVLYGLLHECDRLDLRLIVVVPPPDDPSWRAVHDRLQRATRPVDRVGGLE